MLTRQTQSQYFPLILTGSGLILWIAGLFAYWIAELGPDPILDPFTAYGVTFWFPGLLATVAVAYGIERKWQAFSDNLDEVLIILGASAIWLVGLMLVILFGLPISAPVELHWLIYGWLPLFVVGEILIRHRRGAGRAFVSFMIACGKVLNGIANHYMAITVVTVLLSVLSAVIAYFIWSLWPLLFPVVAIPMLVLGNHIINFFRGFDLADAGYNPAQIDRIEGPDGRVLVPVHIHPVGIAVKIAEIGKENPTIIGLVTAPLTGLIIVGLLTYFVSPWFIPSWILFWFPSIYVVLGIWSRSIYGFTETAIFSTKVEFHPGGMDTVRDSAELKQFKQLSVKIVRRFGMTWGKIDPGLLALGAQESIEGDYISNPHDFERALLQKQADLGM